MYLCFRKEESRHYFLKVEIPTLWQSCPGPRQKTWNTV